MESGQLTIVHGIDTQAWPTKSGPWTIVHGIDPRAWLNESGLGIDFRIRPKESDN